MPLETAAGLFLTDDETDVGPNIGAAIGAGHKFIEVHLSPNADIQGGRMSGVLVVDTFLDGRDNRGIPKYSFNIRGGDIDFVYDAKKYIRVADPPLLDDDESGITGPKGYNRDFLASHWESGIFVIPDKEVEADIKKRAVLIKKMAEEKVFEAPEDPAEVHSVLKDLEAHEKYIAEQKKKLLEQQAKLIKPDMKKAKEDLTEKIRTEEEEAIKQARLDNLAKAREARKEKKVNA